MKEHAGIQCLSCCAVSGRANEAKATAEAEETATADPPARQLARGMSGNSADRGLSQLLPPALIEDSMARLHSRGNISGLEVHQTWPRTRGSTL